MDVHCEIIVGHDVMMVHTMMLQCLLMFLGPKCIMYYYAQL